MVAFSSCFDCFFCPDSYGDMSLFGLALLGESVSSGGMGSVGSENLIGVEQGGEAALKDGSSSTSYSSMCGMSMSSLFVTGWCPGFRYMSRIF